MTGQRAIGAPRGDRWERQRGSASVEATLLAPLLVLLLLFVVACGRLATTRLRVADAAHQGARTASLARDSGTATTTARATVTQALATAGASCGRSDITVDTSAFRAGGTVTVTVTCHATLADLSGLHLPGDTATLTASFTSPVDTYRGVNTASAS